MRPSPEETALSAVGGRLAFVVAFALLIYAVFSHHLPRLFVSTHVTHFAGFFVFSFAAAAAAKRMPILTLGCYVAALAVAIEALRAAVWLPFQVTYLDAVGDLAGIVAAFAPMLLQKIRGDFALRQPFQPTSEGR